MQITRLFSFAAILILALVAFQAASFAAADADVPADLAVKGTKVATVHATGVQIYVCTTKDSKRAWELKAPDAAFKGTDSAGNAIEGKHYKGPTWESTTDGSSVTGRMIRKHNAAVTTDIPWLLVEATGNKGKGALSEVKFIQRLNTSGGVAPAIGDAKEGDVVKVAYTADYVFWGSDATTQPAAAP